MSEDAVEDERRKILAKSVPFMLNAVWEAHQVLSPGYVISTALGQYERMENNAKANREELVALTKDIGKLQLQSEGIGRLSLTLSRSQILVLLANYLSSQFFGQASTNAELQPAVAVPEYDGMLVLPTKSVFVKLLKEDLEQKSLVEEIDKAEALNPSDVCLVAYRTSHRTDILFGPVFVSENKIQRGRFRLMALPDVFREITKGKFSATVEVPKEPQDESVRFLFVKSG